MWKIFSEGHILSTAGDALTTTTTTTSSGVQFAQLLLKLVCYSCGGEVGGGGKRGDETSFSELFGSFEEYYILALLVCVCNAIR